MFILILKPLIKKVNKLFSKLFGIRYRYVNVGNVYIEIGNIRNCDVKP